MVPKASSSSKTKKATGLAQVSSISFTRSSGSLDGSNRSGVERGRGAERARTNLITCPLVLASPAFCFAGMASLSLIFALRPKSTSMTSADVQPTLAFGSRKPSAPSPVKKKAGPARQSSLRQSVSTDDIRQELDDEDDPVIVTDDEAKTLIASSQPLPKSSEKRRLDVKSKKWNGAMRDAKSAMGGLEPNLSSTLADISVHAGPDTHNNVHHILRVFDMTSKYGPCVGITRLARWERAQKWGLNPPDEIREILTTVEGIEDVTYRETVLHGWV